MLRVLDELQVVGGDHPFDGQKLKVEHLLPVLAAEQKFGIVLTYADEDPFCSGAVNAFRTLQDALGYVGAESVGMIYGSASKAGEIKKNKNLLKKADQLGKDLAELSA